MMMNWRIFSDRDLLEEQLVDEVIDILLFEIESKDFATFLISGGSTPEGFFDKLSKRKIPWQKVYIALIDDRLDKNHSNEKLVNSLLLQNESAHANFVSLLPSESNSSNELSTISKRTKMFVENMDCVILGMGTDGHTASLFPGDVDSDRAMQLKMEEGFLAFTNAPSEPIKRITFTLDAISTAKNVFLHLYGNNKKEILKKKENPLPIAKVLRACVTKPQIFFAE